LAAKCTLRRVIVQVPRPRCPECNAFLQPDKPCPRCAARAKGKIAGDRFFGEQQRQIDQTYPSKQ